MSALPTPLVHADLDLRDFAFMPLDVVRLRDSEIAAKVSGEDFRCAVLLWCASWHQVPAGSLPDDDTLLARLAGFGRAVKEWKQHRDGALWGWIKCSDGRLYHPTVTEKATEAWEAKQKQRNRTKAARDARLSQNESGPVTGTNSRSNKPIDGDVTASKGQGQLRDRDSSSSGNNRELGSSLAFQGSDVDRYLPLDTGGNLGQRGVTSGVAPSEGTIDPRPASHPELADEVRRHLRAVAS